MNAVSEIERPTGNEIIALVEANPVMVLTDAKRFSEFYEEMRRETDALDANVATEKGRKAIASMAYKVARTKTAIDDAGKKLNEEARARINAIDESRREIRKQLDELKDEVRQPLTEWEAAEDQRIERAKAQLTKVREMGRVSFDDTAETVASRLTELGELVIDEALHGEGFGIAQAARADALTSLQSASERLIREEEERAELERLRAEAAARDRREAERREAEEAERRRAEAEKAEQERIAALERQAEERAKAEAERKAREEREKAERAHAEELAAERRRAEDAERKEAARLAEIEREAAAQAAREADRAHRSRIMAAAKEAIMESGEVDEAAAKRIVLAIAGNNIPNVSIRF